MTSSTAPSRPIAALLIAILVAACGANVGGGGPVPTPPATPDPSVVIGTPEPTADVTPTPGPTPTTGPSASPAVTPTPVPSGTPGPTMIVRAYFFLEDPDPAGDGPKLVPVLREVPESRAVATAAMHALLAGPTRDEATANPDVVSTVPAGTTLLGLKVENRIATVDLSREFESGGGSASVVGRLAQVVYTLTQFSNVDAVRFLLDGSPVDVFGNEGVILDGPVSREQYRDQLPPIFVDRPAWGAALGNPGRVMGLSNVFEATFRIRVVDANGRTIYDEMHMADCGSGCWGEFDTTVAYEVSRAQWGTLRVYAGSAQDGSPIAVREYPAWLTPG